MESMAFASGKWTDMIDFSGYIQSDIRYIIEDWRGAKKGDGYEFQKNQNDVVLRLEIFPHDNVQAVIEADLRFYGFNRADSLYNVSDRGTSDPFNLQLDEAYIHVRELFWEWLDLRAGRMVVNWGTVDQFNPTDNISARDFSDPINFSAKVPNQMIELTAYPTDWLTLSLIWVPTFRPAQLPDSAPLGFADFGFDKNGCFATAPAPPLTQKNMDDLYKLFESAGDPCNLNFVEPGMPIVTPDFSMKNSQFGAKAQFLINDFEFSFSYYYGRFSFPVALTAAALIENSQVDPAVLDIKYIVELYYPRMQVAGFDFSYSAEWLFDIGIVGEIAVIFPEQVDFGLKAYWSGAEVANMGNNNVPSTPFPKATVGIDYTFTSWLYMNVMYVRGFFDEFNDIYGVHNYMVMAAELKFFEDELKVRTAAALNVDDTSANINGTVTWIIYPSVEVIADVLWFVGNTEAKDPKDYASKSKFGMRAVGRNVVSLKGKFSW